MLHWRCTLIARCRQPYAELILRGIKPIEFRSRPTQIIDARFYVCIKQRKAYEQTASLRV